MSQTRVTLRHVAERAGVSSVAAGCVLLGSGGGSVRVAEKTAERIRKIANELKYRPNQIARQLKGKSSNIIGVLIDSYSPEAHYDLLAKLERLVSKKGYRFMVGQSHGEVPIIQRYTEDFQSRGIDAVICIAHNYPEVGGKIAEICSVIKNVIFIDEPAIVTDKTHYVAKDFVGAIREATNYLVQKGRRRIAFFQTPGWRVMEQRYQGYLQGLEDNGIEVDKELVCDTTFSIESEGLNTELMMPFVQDLVENKKVDAILARNDYVAGMVIKVLHLMHYRIPDDVAVIGFDNLKLSRVMHPSLTTLDPQNDFIAAQGIEMLMRMINGEKMSKEERRVSVRPALIVRESA